MCLLRNNTEIPYIYNLILTQKVLGNTEDKINSDTTNTNLNLCDYMYSIS